jgi:hypothetical protein
MRLVWRGGVKVTSFLLLVACLMVSGRAVHGQTGTVGLWQILPTTMPINPIHLAMLNDGTVLVIAGSGNDATVQNFTAGVWDPTLQTFRTQAVTWDMFCNGMLVLPNGRPFINGGNLQYSPFLGLARTSLYDPPTGQFIDVQNMAHGRWYPTVTLLGDGRVMTFSGLTETDTTNSAVEIYTDGAGWSPEYQTFWVPPLYPRQHLLPNGLVFYSGSDPNARFFNPSTHTWSGVVASTNYGGVRTYGSSVLLPLTPANGYRPKVLIFGGGNPATATTELIDLSVPNPQWQYGPPMSEARIEMNATILPNGKVLAAGGSVNDEDAGTSSLLADLYDPATNTFSSAGANAVPRLYHSSTILLPDATVALMGGNPHQGFYESSVELYSPAYLFNADGTTASRPSIDSVTAGPLGYGAAFQVQTANAADIRSVVLIRPGAPTHSFDTEQRLIGLSFTAGSGVLNVTTPPNSNIAPPGYYMLFVLNSAGTPSVAKFVQLLPAQAAQRPTATIATPASDLAVQAGQSVSFTGSGSSPGGTIASYSWSFPGGTPSSSSAQNPGSIVYSTPGIYAASLTVTDNSGLTSVVPATLMVGVSDFSVSVTPTTQTALKAGTATYAVKATGTPWFTGTVNLAATGLPPGVTASFVPATVAANGTSLMSVYTDLSTAAGQFPFTVNGTSGPTTHGAAATLVVSPTVSPCQDVLTLGYSAGTLNIGVKVGTTTSATWSTSLIVGPTTYSLWSMPIPVVWPPAAGTVPIPGMAHAGNVLAFTTLVGQATCWDLKSINIP